MLVFVFHSFDRLIRGSFYFSCGESAGVGDALRSEPLRMAGGIRRKGRKNSVEEEKNADRRLICIIGEGGFYDDYTETYNNSKNIRKWEAGFMAGFRAIIYKNLSKNSLSLFIA